ncbi:F-box/kelch-repeat protein At1g15670-like, partial [Curcuma longa]|uniref:F-box/kelch-repeat protein At1g15670-like n=1 Tax=Curcuma longa TaxID=136217 RepID=UPI003D9F9A65
MERSRAKRIMSMEAELIPGLPDCLALECLLRLPFHGILNARTVCKRWKHELDSPSFYHIRGAAGLAPRVVSLLLRGKLPHTMGKFHLALYEPDTDVCTMRQLAPDRPKMRPLPPDLSNLRMGGFSNAAVVGRELVVIGGWDAMENRRTGEVNIYDLLSGAWRPGAPNPKAPERFSYKKVKTGGKMLLVGGTDDKGQKLQSALVYDVASDTWLEIPDLGQGNSIDGGNFCDKFWQSKEEYNKVIRLCREKLLYNDDDLTFNPTEAEKEIIVRFPNQKKSDSTDEMRN